MPTTTPDTPTTATDPAAKAARTQRIITVTMSVVGVVIASFLVYAGIYTFTQPQTDVYDDTLPNPMGGPARTAPGGTTGTVELAGLSIDGAEVAMGDVPLGITLVPDWQITNPTDRAVTVTVGQPQVVEGCCPGPVYADGALTQAGQLLTIPAGGTTTLQFPLQMHPGMDGPHHLSIPLSTATATAAVHVTGNFTADAAA
jgi:hypothetical protein